MQVEPLQLQVKIFRGELRSHAIDNQINSWFSKEPIRLITSFTSHPTPSDILVTVIYSNVSEKKADTTMFERMQLPENMYGKMIQRQPNNYKRFARNIFWFGLLFALLLSVFLSLFVSEAHIHTH